MKWFRDEKLNWDDYLGLIHDSCGSTTYCERHYSIQLRSICSFDAICGLRWNLKFEPIRHMMFNCAVCVNAAVEISVLDCNPYVVWSGFEYTSCFFWESNHNLTTEAFQQQNCNYGAVCRPRCGRTPSVVRLGPIRVLDILETSVWPSATDGTPCINVTPTTTTTWIVQRLCLRSLWTRTSLGDNH